MLSEVSSKQTIFSNLQCLPISKKWYPILLFSQTSQNLQQSGNARLHPNASIFKRKKKLLKYANWPEGNPLPVCKSVLRGRTLVPLPQRVYRRRFYLIKRQYLPFRVSRSQKNGQTFRFGPSSLTNQLAFVKKFDGWSSAEGIFLTLREKKWVAGRNN